MSFTATINGVGNFTATIDGVGVFNATLQQPAVFNVGMATAGIQGDKGDTGIVTAQAPLIYDSVIRDISIAPDYYALKVHTHQISDVTGLQQALDGLQPSGDYATNSYVNSTFQPISGMSAYYLASNPAGYITSSALSGYATESWVLGKNYITSAALAPYLTISSAAATYQPIGNYAPAGWNPFDQTLNTTDGPQFSAVLSDNYRPKSLNGNLNLQVYNDTGAGTWYTNYIDAFTNRLVFDTKGGGITFSDGTIQTTAPVPFDPTGYATESWVQSQGYLTSVDGYLPLSGGTMTGNILFGTGGQYIGAGTFDTGRGGANGISLTCSVGYEFNWQAGWLATTEQFSQTRRPLYLDSGSGTHLRAWHSEDFGTEVSYVGITFPDNTQQTTAAITFDPTGYATESWVQSQGYLTAPYNPFDQTLNTTNSVQFGAVIAGYYPSPNAQPVGSILSQYGLVLTEPSGAIQFADGTQQTTAYTGGAGLFNPVDTTKPWLLSWDTDALAWNETGGKNGLLFESYGHAIDFGLVGTSNPAMRWTNSGFSSWMEINPDGIKFPDGTTQTTAPVVRPIPPSDTERHWIAAWHYGDYYSTEATGAGVLLDNGTHSIDFDGSSIGGMRFSGNGRSSYLTVTGGGITFTDGTTQTTAATPFDPTGYATESWVTSQAYLTSADLAPYLTSATAASTYFPIPTGTTSQYIDGTGGLQTFPTGSTATRLETTVYNNSGATIPKHSVVYINGGHGNDPTIALAKADAEGTSRGTFGFTTADIPDQSLGTVVQVGLLENANTNGYVDGTLIFLSPTVAGGWTATQPYSPNHYVALGTIVRGHPTQGTIQVRITNSNELNELSDVQTTSSVAGDLLVRNGSGYWVSQSKATAGIAGLTTNTFVGTQIITNGSGGQITINPNTYEWSISASNGSSTTVLSSNGITFPDATTQSIAAISASTIASTYQTISGMSSYATLASPTFTGDPKAPTPATADNDTSIATTAFVKAQGYTTTPVTDVQTFGTSSTSGSFTWTKPTGAKVVEVHLYGGGGGGGSGARQATTSIRGGGGGGGGGTYSFWRLNAADLGATVSITVGAGGNGSASQTVDSSSGSSGSNGSDTIFGSYRTAGGASGNGGSSTAGGTGAGGRTGILYGNASIASGTGGTGGAASPPAVTSASNPWVAQGGGGGGGQIASVTTGQAGAIGGSKTAAGTNTSGWTSTTAGGTAGSAAGGAGGNGTNLTDTFTTGTGGGGGGYATGIATGGGGNGGWPSGGGGGGAASDNGFASGKGGNGANGKVVVITYF